MITIYSDFYYSELTQKIYNHIINSLNLLALVCPACGNSGCMVVHGYYSRGVKTTNGFLSLCVMRVKCKVCKRTHALLPDSVIPYSFIQNKDAIRILTNDNVKKLMEDNTLINESDIFHLRSLYNHFFKQLIISYQIKLDYSVTYNCLLTFFRSFMQIRRGVNILFKPST